MDVHSLPVSRRKAQLSGSTYYFTSKQCKNGHISARQTNNGTCIDCNRCYANNHYERNTDSRILSVSQYRDLNPTKAKKWAKQSYKNNKPAYFARSRLRQTRQLQRTPSWLSNEQLLEIQNFYKERDRLTDTTGIVHHVDHIIPLRGSNVSGLHVPWNLRVIPYYENLSKGNKLISEVA